MFSYASGLPIITGTGTPSSGLGQTNQLYIQTDVTPQAIWIKQASTWVLLTSSTLYVDMTSNQTIAGIKTFSSPIVSSAASLTNFPTFNQNTTGTASNVTGVVAILNGGTGSTTASTARTALGLGTIATQDASSVSITGGSITGITDLAIADGGTGASTAATALSNLGAYPASNPAGYGTGTVTSVAATVPTGLAITGSPVTTSGTLAISNEAGYAIPTTASQTTWDTAYTDRLKWDGGSSGLVAATGRTSLGLGSAAVLTAGAANGVATLDSGGTVPLSQIPASIQGGVSYQGTWNASTNTPTLTSSVGTKGYYYVVSVAGSTNLNGVTSWNIGDWAIYNGTAWEKIDNTDAVTSVNGYTGTVVLGYSDVGAPSVTGTNATGTWPIAITGNAATATNATTATNQSGGTVNATTGTFSGAVNLPASTSSLVPLHISAGTTPSTLVDGDIWIEPTGAFVKNSTYVHQIDFDTNTTGVLSRTVITITGSGSTLSCSSVKALLYSTSEFQGDFKTYTIPAATGLTLVDNALNALIVSYNGGSPVFSTTTDLSIINGSSVVGAATLYRTGVDVHYQSVDWGLATASTNNKKSLLIYGIQRASGLSLDESTGRVITLTAGSVWYASTEYVEPAITSASSNCEFWYHSGGAWTHTNVSTYNNTQYDNGTNLVTLSGAGTQYAVNWVYRYVNGDTLPKLAYVLGGGNYNLTQAQAAAVTIPPPILSSMAILVGRIIVAQNASTATQINSAFTTAFAGTTVADHNDLANLQGGTVNEYFHLTSSEYTGTGTGTFVRATSPTLITPALGTPSALVGTNITGTASNLTAGSVTTVTPAQVSDQANTSTGFIDLPSGTTAQRGSPTSGSIRYNTDTPGYEGYNGSAWGSLGGGNTTTKGLWENANSITANYTIGTNNNATSTGPISVASGISVTVPSGSRWVVL
jgi:hypothetical protein